jgi:fatty acid desaturase
MSSVCKGAAMLGDRYVEAFHELTAEANNAGLMRRRYGFYWAMILFWTLATAAILVGVVLLGDTWYQLILAALLGLAMAQLGFLGHEAAHQEIFASRGWNEWTARVLAGLFTGLSYGWWVDKHGRHHANPNKEREDPDAESGVLSFTPEGTDKRTGLAAKLGKYQGFYFLPLLFFEGFSLHADSFKNILTGKDVTHRWTEILFVGIRVFGYLAFLFIVLPPGMAVAFVAVQVAVFGFLLGGAFSPNHIGMPTVPHDADIDFLRRQVHMSRNIRGGVLVHFFMGGLEYQVEHHLFPMAPRPNLPALQELVRKHCADNDIPYTETTLGEAFRTIIAYLNQVGLKNRDPYTCPLVRQFRG